MKSLFVNVFEGTKTWLFKKYSQDASKMLLHTGTAGWILSAAAQVFGIVHNDKLTSDEKKFLVPQEIFDAIINITSFYFLTNSLQNFTKKLASTGKIITPGIKAYCEKHGIKVGQWKTDIGKALADKIGEAENAIKSRENAKKLFIADGLNINESEIAKLDRNIELAKAEKAAHEEIKYEFDPLQSGMKIVGNIIGTIVSSNIITPLLRNPLAARRQRKEIEREQKLAELQNPAIKPKSNIPNINKPLNTYQPRITQSGPSLKI